MRWCELIRLRSATDCRQAITELVRQTAAEKIHGAVDIRTYHGAALEYDTSIHIYWESDRCHANGSGIGNRISYTLKEFGLVDHSVWIEHPTSTPQRRESTSACPSDKTEGS